MKKRILHICTVFLTLIVFVQSLVFSSAAATAKITVSAPSVVNPGESFKATVSVAGDKLYGVNGAVTFSEGLELVKAEKALSGSWKTELNTKDGTVYFAAADQKQSSPISGSTKLLTLTLKATGEFDDNVKITVKDVSTANTDSLKELSAVSLSRVLGKQTESSDDSSDDGYNDSYDNSYDDGTATDTVDENGLSNNNLLKSLVVKNAEISPEFDPEVKSYKATVPFTVKELQVEAEAQDENATVTIGDTALEYVGNNIVRVQVVSESGLKRTYKLYITREDKLRGAASEEGGLSLVWIILICVGAAVLLAAIAVAVIIILKKRKKKLS